MIINIASLRNNGIPSTEEVIEFYKYKLQIKHTTYEENEKDIFARPGWTRNRQISESSADWFMCHNCDTLLHPDRMASINYTINRIKNIDYCLCSWKNLNTDAEETNTVVNSNNSFYIENAFEIATKIKQFDASSYDRPCRKGPGGFLVFSKETIKNKANGLYAPLKRNRDRHLFNQFMLSRNDLDFRRAMGYKIIKQWPTMIHLNHKRDKELGYHIEDQR